MRLLLAVCFAVALCGTASAEEEHFSTMGAVKGQGAVSCAKFAKYYRAQPDETEETFFAWALGFMSGLNHMGEDQGIFFDLKAKTNIEMKSFLRQYCNAHPLAAYGEGVVELQKSLPVVKGKQ